MDMPWPYRMFYALTSGSGTAGWRTSSGEPTAGVYGFARVLLHLLENEKPDYLARRLRYGQNLPR